MPLSFRFEPNVSKALLVFYPHLFLFVLSSYRPQNQKPVARAPSPSRNTHNRPCRSIVHLIISLVFLRLFHCKSNINSKKKKTTTSKYALYIYYGFQIANNCLQTVSHSTVMYVFFVQTTTYRRQKKNIHSCPPSIHTLTQTHTHRLISAQAYSVSHYMLPYRYDFTISSAFLGNVSCYPFSVHIRIFGFCFCVCCPFSQCFFGFAKRILST